MLDEQPFVGASLIGNHPFESNRIYLSNGLQQGYFLVGPKVTFANHSARHISEYIARRDNSDEYVLLKVLHSSEEDQTSSDHNQEKVLLHNEHLILSLLQDQPGVIQHVGLFKHRRMFILALECVMSHEYDKKGLYKDYVNLQQHIINKKRLQDSEALVIFSDVVATVRDLHQKNIVHRDLKLGNIAYNSWSKKVKLINFSMSKHLVRDSEQLTDQRGSLAYVSPDILSGHPYDGKASDMWAMGIMLYTMVCGQFPFYDNNPQELFKKISLADYYIPCISSGRESSTFELIRKLIVKEPNLRLTATQSLEMAQQLLSMMCESKLYEDKELDAQVVPDNKGTENFTDCVVPDYRSDFESNPDLALSCITAGLNISSLPSISHYFAPATIPYQGLPRPRSATASAGLTTTNSSGATGYSYSLPPTTEIQRKYSHSTFTNRSLMLVNSHGVSRSSEQLHVPNQLSTHCTSHLTARRNSIDSDKKVRRHSAAHFRTTAPPGIQRQRRISHDTRDNQSDLLQRLHNVATRSRSSISVIVPQGSSRNLRHSVDQSN